MTLLYKAAPLTRSTCTSLLVSWRRPVTRFHRCIYFALLCFALLVHWFVGLQHVAVVFAPIQIGNRNGKAEGGDLSKQAWVCSVCGAPSNSVPYCTYTFFESKRAFFRSLGYAGTYVTLYVCKVHNCHCCCCNKKLSAGHFVINIPYLLTASLSHLPAQYFLRISMLLPGNVILVASVQLVNWFWCYRNDFLTVWARCPSSVFGI
jgi:hypothetical protein